MPVINNNQDYVKWMVKIEKELMIEGLDNYIVFYNKLQEQSFECTSLFHDVRKIFLICKF